MTAPIQIMAHEEVDEGFLTQIRTWAREVLERAGSLSPSRDLCITIWKNMEGFQSFYRREKEELGVVAGEDYVVGAVWGDVLSVGVGFVGFGE